MGLPGLSKVLLWMATGLSLFVLNTARSDAAPTEPAYDEQLIGEAIRLHLSEERQWWLLLHYKRRRFGGIESQEDGQDFFLAPRGKTDPEAELIATIQSFFRSPQSLDPNEEHPQCTFPARYRWLKARLSFDPALLPEQVCPRIEQWLQGLSPSGVTLVFSSYYMNNPASMFGHTFLRIDRTRNDSSPPLTDYGVDYAAVVDTKNVLLYAVKGLFGLFKGRFSVIPYYTKVQEYGNWESRDLWEYQLDFTDEELRGFLLHLWELGGNHFDYFYFQENCSYHILSVLEVAKPDLYLTDQFGFWVIPSDTVKVVTAVPSLVRGRTYRPSLVSRMNQQLLNLSDAERKAFRRVSKSRGDVSGLEYQSLGAREKARVLDTYLDYREFNDLRTERRSDSITPETRRVLIERSRLPPRAEEVSLIEFSAPPELGHDSARVGLAQGVASGETFVELRIRPAFHDFLARDIGFGRDSQILFADLAVRYDSTRHFRVDRFQIVDVLALTPYDPLFRSWSLHFGLAIDTLRDIDCGLCNAGTFVYGVGLTYRPGRVSPLRVYSLVDATVQVSGDLDRSYRLGGNLKAGGLFDVGDNWRFQIEGAYAIFPFGHRSSYPQITYVQRYAVTRNLDVRFAFDRLQGWREWSLAANLYF